MATRAEPGRERKANGSRRGGEHEVNGDWLSLTVLNAFGEHAQRQDLRLGHGLSGCCAIRENAGKLGHFSDPAAIVFALDFEVQLHTD